jgi:hypothetical protein
MRTYLGWSGLMVVATASRTWTGRDEPRCTVMRKWSCPVLSLGYCTASRIPFIREALRVSGVHFDGRPNSSYNEYTCYTNVPRYRHVVLWTSMEDHVSYTIAAARSNCIFHRHSFVMM